MNVSNDNRYAITLMEITAEAYVYEKKIPPGTILQIRSAKDSGALTFVEETDCKRRFGKPAPTYSRSNIDGLLFFTPDVYKFAIAITDSIERITFCQSDEQRKFILQLKPDDAVKIPHGSFAINDGTFRRATVNYIGSLNELGIGFHFIVTLMRRDWSYIPTTIKKIATLDSLEINTKQCVILSADYIFKDDALTIPDVKLFHLYGTECCVDRSAAVSECAGPQFAMLKQAPIRPLRGNSEIIKKVKRVHDDFPSERAIISQHGKSGENASLLAGASQHSRADESRCRSSKPKKTLPAEAKKKHRRSRSATATMSERPLSRVNSGTERMSRSKYRTPSSRLRATSADQWNITPVTPKIQMNTSTSLIRYPKVGETIISMSGSPVIVNGGAMQRIASINIPIEDGVYSMQPNAITDVDSDLFSRIDSTTMNQLRQLKKNLDFVVGTFGKSK